MIAGRGLIGLALAGRLARWVGAWPARRVGLAAVAGGLLVMAAVLGYAGPLLAQEGVDIQFGDLSSEPTDTTVDRFFVELSNLTAATAYEVVVASDHAAALGIGACGTATQTRTVTGATAQDLAFVVYACALGSGTLTAEVRQAGADTAAATVSQALTVLAIPEGAPAGVPGAAAAAAASRGATRAGTPGVVPNVRFDNITTHSARARWAKPSNGGRALTGFGLLFWRKGTPQPPYSTAFVVGAASRSHTYTGLRAGATYRFRIHACNGADSCGWWTHPPREVRIPTPAPTPTPTPTTTTKPTAAPTVGPPGQVQSLRTSNRTATSFTVHWSPHSDTGGRPLTGFGLLRREPPNAWPSHDQATVVGAASRSHSFTGLTYGRGQGVRIRACNGTNSCGAWSAEVTVTPLPGPLPTLALPKTTIAIGERMKIGANDVPVGATAYIRLEGPIQPEGRCGASGAARAPAAPRAPSPSTGPGYYDSIWIDGCAPGGDDAVVRLESQDGSVLYDRRELTVATAAPRQVGRPVVSPRDAALHVDWEAPNDGGSAITHYDVGHRAGAAGAWTETEVRSGTSTTITELTNGTSYQVRVRAVNAKGDGEWSETVTGTPQVDAGAPVAPGPGEPTLAPPACDPIADPGSTTPASLGQPNNLHVTPFQNRRAVLAWNSVPGAAKYVVQIRQRSATGWGNWLPPDRRAGETASGDITAYNCYTVGLDRVITQTSGASEGLADSVAYGLRVRAVNGSVTSAYSSEAIIIDSPIIEANGKSSAGAPQVKLTWLAIGDILGSDYSTGTYAFHHRRLGGNHQDLGWTLDTFFPVEVFSQSSTNPDTIKQLTMEQVFAIQLRFEGTGPQRTSTVFAARDAYAWPSARAADGGERVATFPLNNRVKNRTYAYRICPDGFPGDITQWENLINHALGQWQLATNGLVRMVHESGDCADYDAVYNNIRTNYGAQFGQPLSREELDHLREYLSSLDILTTAHIDDIGANEIVMINDADGGTYENFEKMGLFDEFSTELGLAKCIFRPYATACVVRKHNTYSKGWTSDILMAETRFGIGPFDIPGGLDPDGGVTTDRDDVRFNTCDAAPSGTYEVLVHEGGHALGIRDARSLAQGWDGSLWHHPSIYESVISYEGLELKNDDAKSKLPDDPDCSPHPLDVLAIYALYQQESSP